jgi:hypothetical protein
VSVKDWLENFYSVQNFILPTGREPFASWMKLPPTATIPQIASPKNIHILCVGGGTNFFWQAADFGYISGASIDKWR